MFSSKKYITKDHGTGHKKFKSGAVREFASGKGRYDLISPFIIDRLAGILERGMKKYAARNWEKGMPLSRYFDSAFRHLMQELEGQKDEDHIGQAVWNMMTYIHTKEMIDRGLLPAELNDMPNYTKEGV